jgi:hypothetical protein
MKDPALFVYTLRAFDVGSAARLAGSIASGLRDFDEDGSTLHEAICIYQWDSTLEDFLRRVEEWLSRNRERIQRLFIKINDDTIDDSDVERPFDLVLYCQKTGHPQVVLEFRKLLKRFFPDTPDLYEVLDVTISIDPNRLRGDFYEIAEDCERFQQDLFA